MKKTMPKTVHRKLAVHSESIVVLRSSQLTRVDAGFLPVPPRQPRSELSGCGTQPPFI